MSAPLARSAAAASSLVLLLAGCATTGAAEPAADDEVQVLASFYPLQYVAERVGGDLVQVSSLTPPGAEPHDVELSPRQVREVGTAALVVTLGGFQPAVDEALAARAPEHVVDATTTPAVAEHLEEAAVVEDEHADEHHAEDEHADGVAHDGHDHAAGDPHFWLDPTLLAAVTADVADGLAAADPDNAAVYAANAEALQGELAELDTAFADGLAECERRTVVTAHAAFGFLAERYGLEQVGISGIEPDAEPSPARLREMRDVVAEHGVTTVFTEPLLDPSVAETLAADLGVRTAVLDPVESQADPATDYRGVMQQNLEALREALGCR